jgi:hypothetical protein
LSQDGRRPLSSSIAFQRASKTLEAVFIVMNDVATSGHSDTRAPQKRHRFNSKLKELFQVNPTKKSTISEV